MRNLIIISLVIVAIIGANTWLLLYKFGEKNDIIAEMEAKLAILTADIRPGPQHIDGGSVTAGENGAVLVRFENSAVMTLSDTGPMLPWLAEGIEVVMERTSVAKVGDVIAFENGGALTLSRITGEQNGKWVVRSDRSYESSVVSKDAVLYRLFAVLY